MGVVDTIVVGPLGAEATGAVGLGSNLYIASAIFGIGILLGLDTLVSQEHGAGREEDARRSLAQGVYLALAMGPLLTLAVWGLVPLLPRLGILEDVLRLTAPYLDALAWGSAPLLVFSAIRRYLQGVGVVKPITFALVTANLVNLVGCWSLVHGKLGLPRMGVEGAGWATSVARTYMMVVLIAAFARYGPLSRAGHNPFRGWPGLEWPRLRKLMGLGFPAAIQVTLEVGVFAAATALAGRLDATSLASHNIVLLISSVTYMVPLGIASAGAVRVGHALGRGDSRGAATSGWTALAIGAGFMTLSGLTLLTMSRPIIGAFTEDPAVIATTTRLFVPGGHFPALRRRAGGGHRGPPRGRRHPNLDGLQPPGPLGDRPPHRLRPGLRDGVRGRRPLGRPLDRTGPGRPGEPRRLGAGGPKSPPARGRLRTFGRFRILTIIENQTIDIGRNRQ